jgi:hypothetical protein
MQVYIHCPTSAICKRKRSKSRLHFKKHSVTNTDGLLPLGGGTCPDQQCAPKPELQNEAHRCGLDLHDAADTSATSNKESHQASSINLGADCCHNGLPGGGHAAGAAMEGCGMQWVHWTWMCSIVSLDVLVFAWVYCLLFSILNSLWP